MKQERDKRYIVKIEHLDVTSYREYSPETGRTRRSAGTEHERYVRLPKELMEQLDWDIGDEVEWEETEIWDENRERQRLTLSNLTKNLKENKYAAKQDEEDESR